MTGAAFNRATSKQNYATPKLFLAAVEDLIGEKFAWDLAADASNAACDNYIDEARNSLSVDWAELLAGGWGWLNPPFKNIAPWARKCREEAALGAKIALLVPAAVGSNWFRDNVYPASRVLFLNGRLSFDGKNPYPKDCMICLFGRVDWLTRACAPWSWRPVDA